jgi:hypothetical protein
MNWMIAGSGITHSERFEQARREAGPMHAIQSWVALPDGAEEIAPSFAHHEGDDPPVQCDRGVAKYKGNPDRMFIWAHSAGNGPLGVYIGHPELHGPKGPGVKGAIFMSGNPVPGVGGAATAPARGAPNPLADAGKACGVASGADPNATEGAISGPSSVTAGGGAPGGARGPQPIDAATQAARSNLPGLKSTKVAIVLARAELDPGVNGDMLPSDIALHDEMCTEGKEHCPTMFYLRGESHMSEVFSIDTDDKTVSGPILAWMKKVQ